MPTILFPYTPALPSRKKTTMSIGYLHIINIYPFILSILYIDYIYVYFYKCICEYP